MGWMRRKSIDLDHLGKHQRLTPTLSWWHLVAMGVGAVVGTGIYTLVGVGAGLAGPAVTLSFVIAGLVCICAALAYAEVSSLIPASGSAYTYTYVAMGEVFAWMVGWALILEYSLVVSTVAVGWSGYAVGFLSSMGLELPIALTAGPASGGLVNAPAVLIVAVVTVLLMLGTRESATVNAVLVVIKIAALILFVIIALPNYDAAHFDPFMPYGFFGNEDGGTQRGVMVAAAILFFAFYGFDAVSTAAEETMNPSRDLPIGIIGSLIVCISIYIAVAMTAIGAVDFREFASSAEPLSFIMRSLGNDSAAALVAAAAVIALPTVILAFLYGQSRIFFVMARDGLFPKELAKISPRTGTPIRMTIVTAIIVSILAAVVPLGEIAALANAGTLVAFIAVSVCLLVLRYSEPDRQRLFKVPAPWLVGSAAILGCLYLFANLPRTTHLSFAVWSAIGISFYVIFNTYIRPTGRAAEE